MTLEEAIYVRTSRRNYIESDLKQEHVDALQNLIDKYNQIGGFRVELVLNNGEAFKGFSRSYGMLSGVKHYFGFITEEDDPHASEKIGYYGQLLVLHATTLGLGTCWVGGTFSKSKTPFELADGERLACLITVGEVEKRVVGKEKFIYQMTHRKKSKTPEEMYEASEQPPKWFLSGMEAVSKAPSAVNRQPVMLHYKDGEVCARMKGKYLAEFDLGIAKLHFEIGVGGGLWEWGNDGRFTAIELEVECENRFSKKASSYDNDHRSRRARAAAEKVYELTEAKKNGNYMEYGCGTGLVGFHLAQHVNHITLIDSSEGMIDVLKEKIPPSGMNNLTPRLRDLTKEPMSETFDVIYNSMVLHHIEDTEEMIKIFYDTLENDGQLCIIDLDKEDGSFHSHVQNYSGYNGFDQQYLIDLFEKCGFVDVKAETFYQNGTDHVFEGKVIPYSLFAISGRKEK